MSPKYRSRTEKRSRLAKVENQKINRQIWVLILITIAMLIMLVMFGLPLITRLAIFFGDLRGTTTPVSQTDNIPPTAPRLAIPYQATSSASIDLNGYTESGATVKLYIDNVEAKDTTADESGKFTFSAVKLDEGSNTFQVLAIDQAGNESTKSSITKVTRDNTPPETEILSPQDGQQFFGFNERTITITGQTEEGAKILVNERFIVVRSDGSFSARYQLEENDNELKILSTDQAGNSSEQSLTIKYTP